MTAQEVSNIIQVLAVVVAVGASVVALAVSAKDRRAAAELAVRDRRAVHLRWELGEVMRLLENRNRGGSSDKLERDRLGAEALTLVGTLGRARVPRQWDRQIRNDDSGLRRGLDDPELPEWKKDAVEAQLAAYAVLRDLENLQVK